MHPKSSPVCHPKPCESGAPVWIAQPSVASPLSHWTDPRAAATVLPGGALPPALGGIPLASWTDVPDTAQDWQRLADLRPLPPEPPLAQVAGLAAAAGVVVREADGRIWLVAPTNRFGGYVATFPKGRRDAGLDLRATAIKEAWEESGLRVELVAWLADVQRTQTITRYYLARRTGGSPAEMGWESQAVHLVPPRLLHEHLLHPSDATLLEQLRRAG